MADLGIKFAQPGAAGNAPPPTDPLTFVRQEAVRQAFQHAWSGYDEFAFGKDQLKPMSRTGEKGLCDMGLTLVDALDTMVVMDLPAPFDKSRQWVASNLTFDHQEDVNLFETTIRVVGGLLGTYDLTGDELFLDKAQDLAKKMMVAFNSPTGIPYGTLGLCVAAHPSCSGPQSGAPPR